MKNIKDFETKMIHNGNRNVKYALVKCSYCGEDKWEQWQRVKRQENFFCDRKHCNLWQKDQAKHVGKENARFNWDESNHRWIAQWWEESNGKRVLKNTTKAKWLWEQVHGEIPDGYWIMYGDDNSENCKTENLELISRGKRMSKALMGHKHSEETRKRISLAHTGKVKWEGFVSKQAYPGLSKRRKSETKERDSFTCQICGKYLKGSSRAIVHHIDGDKTNQDMNNLVLVCRKCHALIHCKKPVPESILAFRSMLKY